MKKIKDSGTITLGIRETSTPFSYLDDKQQPIGYSIDLCMAVVERIRCSAPGSSIKCPNVDTANRA